MSYAVTAIIVSFIVKKGEKAIKSSMKWVGGFPILRKNGFWRFAADPCCLSAW
jgi:uncharacterized membrane protein YeiB